jgi:hypothetical protein
MGDSTEFTLLKVEPTDRLHGARVRSPTRGIHVWLLAMLIAWAGGATALVIRAAEAQSELRRSHENNVRELTHRLVGVASQQTATQDARCADSR